MEFTYKGLKGQLTRHCVTEVEIDRALQRMVQQNPKVETITDRPAQAGDEVILDYAGFCDGKQFEGGTAENQSLILGSGMFIPGFEEQLVGKNIGEEVLVDVTFPAVYHSQELAGKAAQFRCTIHKILVKSPSVLDDAFAKEFGKCDNVDQFREVVRKDLQSYADEKSEMALQDQLLRQAAATLDFSISPEELDKTVEDQIQSMVQQLAQQGATLEMYCAFMRTTEEEFRRNARPAAETALRNLAAVDKIVELEGLVPEVEELQKAIEAVCRRNEMTIEQLMPLVDEAFEKALVKQVLTAKVMQLIRDAAEVTVAEE